MFARLIRLVALCASALTLIACADNAPYAAKTLRIDYGYVESIQVYRTADNQPINVGAVLGGLAGGVIGHQIGSGSGNTVATIAGAIGGAFVGNEIEKTHVQGSRYRITVRLDSGSTLVVEDTRDVDLRVGDRVRVENNRVYGL
jgi:outer membrane lipoprotein SlyB